MSDAFDYIVVGAGSAGATLATRGRAESGVHRVLLLEAGTEELSYFWSRIPVGVSKMIDLLAINAGVFAAEPDVFPGGRRIDVPRGNTLGGSKRYLTGSGLYPRPVGGLRPLGAARHPRLELAGRAAGVKRTRITTAARTSARPQRAAPGSPTRRARRSRCSRR